MGEVIKSESIGSCLPNLPENSCTCVWVSQVPCCGSVQCRR